MYDKALNYKASASDSDLYSVYRFRGQSYLFLVLFYFCFYVEQIL